LPTKLAHLSSALD